MSSQGLSCTVIIPCHNEEENIEECIRRIPKMGSSTEIIVVDDGSTDGTGSIIKNIMGKDERVRLISYSKNMGKGFAVKKGFDEATGDILMILDADMSVEPEELPAFYRAIAEGRAEVVNGTRMVLPMERGAMSRLHYFGNKLFALIFSYLLDRRITDTLCGTKALKKKDYEKIEMGRCPWGDFDILIGVAKLNLKMIEVPVRYRARRKGTSKMKTFQHGLLLLKMCFYAFKELKLGRKRLFS